MSSDKIIVISPSSQKTLDCDVNKLSDLIESVTNVAGKKLNADFSVNVISDMPELTGNVECSHIFGIVNHSEEFINLGLSTKIPHYSMVKCVKCTKAFDLFRSAEDINKYLRLDGKNEFAGVICK